MSLKVQDLLDFLTVAAMFLMAAAPLLADTAPGSDRSIVFSIAGAITALVLLISRIEARLHSPAPAPAPPPVQKPPMLGSVTQGAVEIG
jgi:cytochrome b561